MLSTIGLAVWVFSCTGVATALLTPLVRRYLLWQQLLDQPSARRSHCTPTPRGGGIALIVVYIVGIMALYAYALLDQSAYRAVLGAGAMVAIVSVVDDHRPLALPWRLGAHIVAVVWLLYCLGVPHGWMFPGSHLIHTLFVGLGLVWLINLYNFMDGIDGLAAGETLVAGLAAAALLGAGPAAGLLWLMAGGCAGFLLWNRPPARLFMGDSGSCLLGCLWAAVVLINIQHEGEGLPLAVWLILLGVFLVDASWTLLRRLFTGQRWWQAHRDHAYQHAAQRYGHAAVTGAVLTITLVWLWPWAYWVVHYPQCATLAVAVAWLPLLALALKFQAGCHYPAD